MPPHHEALFAGICHLLDRKEWGKYAGAQECIDREANGLVANGTWNYEDVVPRKELLDRKTPLNIGRLMTLLSSRKAKIVFTDDDIRDEAINLAILARTQGSSNGKNSGINFNLTYGTMKSHQTSQSDVVKAYTQSDLITRVPTWVELPREFTPASVPARRQTCVRLWKSSYTASGFHWHRRFNKVMEAIGGEHSELFHKVAGTSSPLGNC